MTTSTTLFSTVSSDDTLSLEFKEVEIAQPKDNEVLVKIELAPINPSDMWPMFSIADLSKTKTVFNDKEKKLTAPLHPGLAHVIKSRIDQTLPVGNEGAGIVVAAGQSESAQALLGKRVAVLSGSTYAEYCLAPVHLCIPHADTTSAKQAASSFVNPLTALSMVETMRAEGHTALVHTAAASNVGQMLNRICLADGIKLINIVRSAEQVSILESLGAQYIINTSADNYKKDLFNALKETKATLAFDATGGGKLASEILTLMEAVFSEGVTGLNTYGSKQLKQVYIYGALDQSTTLLNRSYGMNWGVGGWLLMNALGKMGPDRAAELYARVATEIDTTFLSSYTDEISFEEALSPGTIKRYMAKKTGEKFLINPSL